MPTTQAPEATAANEAPTVVNPLREGLTRRKKPDPTSIVLFGASGDLTRRKLLPALYNLGRDGLLPCLLYTSPSPRDS